MNNFTRSNLEATFRAAMADAGLTTPDPIIADGKLHRIRIDGDFSGERNGWYVLLADEPLNAAFGWWKTYVTGTWRPVGVSTAIPGFPEGMGRSDSNDLATAGREMAS